MKVLIISAAFPPMQAGETTNAVLLCEHLADQGLEVHVLTTSGNGGTSNPSIQVHACMRDWSWSDVPRFVKILKRCSPDAVLLMHIGWIYNHHPMITFAPTISKKLLPRVPFVTRFENPIGAPPPRRPSILTRAFRKGIMRWLRVKDAGYNFGTLLRDSSCLIVLSERHRQHVANREPGIVRKSVLIPPPPNMRLCSGNNGTTRKRGRETLGVKPDDFLVSYLGYIYSGKGVETLLRAFALVRNQRSNVGLVMIGGGIDSRFSGGSSYIQELHELSRQLGLDSKIKWTGEYAWDTDEASVYLRAADVCVLPFDTGVQLNNSSFAAAAAHGLPIITTRGATLEQPFIHQENVFLCAPKSPEAMAAAIKTVMDNPDLRARLRKGSLKLAEERFSWESAIERTIGTFSQA